MLVRIFSFNDIDRNKYLNNNNTLSVQVSELRLVYYSLNGTVFDLHKRE